MATMRRRAEQRRAAALVLALHGALLWGLWHVLLPQRAPSPRDAPALLWVLTAPAAPQPRPPVPDERPAPPLARKPPTRVADSRPGPEPQAITAPAELPPVAELAEAAAAAPVQAASGVPPLVGSLLDTAATRRAVRESALASTLTQRADAASGKAQPATPSQRLGQQIEQAALGDCLKGEYAGGGMGILSLPFFLAAELRGKCRR